MNPQFTQQQFSGSQQSFPNQFSSQPQQQFQASPAQSIPVEEPAREPKGFETQVFNNNFLNRPPQQQEKQQFQAVPPQSLNFQQQQQQQFGNTAPQQPEQQQFQAVRPQPTNFQSRPTPPQPPQQPQFDNNFAVQKSPALNFVDEAQPFEGQRVVGEGFPGAPDNNGFINQQPVGNIPSSEQNLFQVHLAMNTIQIIGKSCLVILGVTAQNIDIKV